MLGGAAPIVTAHRGYSTAAPENTLPAFQLAIDHHSDRAELDVQMTCLLYTSPSPRDS